MSQFNALIFGVPHSSRAELTEPVCQWCGKTLRRRTENVKMGDEGAEIVSRAVAWTKRAKEWITLFCGEYDGYGFQRDEDGKRWGDPLFCRQKCGISFASFYYEYGKRVSIDGVTLTR